MSLIIKGLNLDDLSTDAYCIQVSFFTKDAFRTISVPINKVIQISTPHGRLIDADKLPKDMFLDTPIVLQKDIDNAPTILEAEKGE